MPMTKGAGANLAAGFLGETSTGLGPRHSYDRQQDCLFHFLDTPRAQEGNEIEGCIQS